MPEKTDPPSGAPGDGMDEEEAGAATKDEATETPEVAGLAGDETRPRFGTVRRGFRPKEVDAFILELEGVAHKLEAQVRQATLDRQTATILGGEPAARSELSTRLESQLSEITGVAERGSRTMVAQAREEAAQIRSDAEARSASLVAEARDDAKRALEDAELFLEDAKAQARRMSTELEERREEMLGGLETLQQRLLGLLPDLQVALDAAAGAPGGTTSTAEGPSEPPSPAAS